MSIKIIFDGDEVNVEGKAETQEEWDATLAEIEEKVIEDHKEPDPLAIVCEAITGMWTDIPFPCDPMGCQEQKGRPKSAPLWWVIIHLNDEHAFTREAVADWLEGLDVDLTFG